MEINYDFEHFEVNVKSLLVRMILFNFFDEFLIQKNV